MDINAIQNDKLQSALIKVETLQKEYEVTLQQYQEAGQNYVTALQSSSTPDQAPEYTDLQGRSWWGTSGVAEGSASSKEECENMCSSSGKCTGATFNPVKRYCWARGGDGSISAGLDSDIALIPKQKAALSVMKSLNEKLLTINEQITSTFKNMNPEVLKQMIEKNKKQQQLSESYQRLLEQKIEIEKQLQEYYSIEENNDNQSLFANQQNISMRVWVLITCLVLLITIKRIVGSDSAPISVIIWLSIIIVLIILTYSLSSPSGFAMWFIVIIVIFLMKSGNFPSP